MRYSHSFTVNASMEAVVAFHRRSESMGAITPPPVIVQVHSAPEQLQDGDEMDFSMWLGPMPIRWVARIEDVTESGFVDRQISGPFAKWVHRHTFEELDGGVQVRDEIEAEYSPNPFWRFVGIGMWLNMPVLFAYRQWKTRRLLTRLPAYA